MRYLVGFYFFFNLAFSQIATLEVDTSLLRIGEQFNVTIKVSGTNLDSLKWPNNDEVFQDFELLNSTLYDKLIDSDTFGYKTYTLTSFDTGLFILPKISIINIEKDTLLTNSVDVEFISFAVDSLPLYGIRPPKNIKFHISELLSYYPFFLVCLLVIFIIYIVKYLSKKDYKKVSNIEEKSPIDVRFLEQLNHLSNKKYIDNGEYLKYYVELSEIFRSFLEERFNVLALESSSYELKNILKSLSVNDDWINNFLRVSDLVKFAKGVPSKGQSKLFLNNHVEFVKKYSHNIENNQLILDKSIPSKKLDGSLTLKSINNK